MLATYLGVPFPKSYMLPIAMESVVHAHWEYDPRFPRTAYIVRDGRDIVVSLYFYYVRAMSSDKNPSRARWVNQEFDYLYGPNFDPRDSLANLPRFIDHFWGSPRATHGRRWSDHVLEWIGRPQVSTVTYEALRADPIRALSELVQDLTGETVNEVKVSTAVQRFSFETSTGRKPGAEDPSSFLRKGIVGDWRNHFSSESAQSFEALSGEGLIAASYEEDNSWIGTI
ncbi:hypothetical protein CEY15_17150 [Dietzia natronolimnaea]|uniref:Sulfotransferase domain-containing protein n=2 Tax=Dietzia natronolimnaea TaxID=161920 RepID=A0A2A2WKN9_9ACTN|nr:hypothetical protein CEY15_17150 [Dietzia natronolimnaea]